MPHPPILHRKRLRLGIQLKLSASIALILLVSAVLLTMALRYQATQDAHVRDQQDAELAMRRLLKAFDTEVDKLDDVLGSWAHRDSLYQYAAAPGKPYTGKDVSPEALRAAHMDWMHVMDMQGHALLHGEVPAEDGSLPAKERLRRVGQEGYEAFWRTMQIRRVGCGIAQSNGVFSFLCFQPLLPTDGNGVARGTVVIGRWLSADTLSSIQRESGLDFQLIPLPEQPVHPSGSGQLQSRIGSGSFTIDEYTHHLDISFPIIAIRDVQVGVLVLRWDRTALAQLEETFALLAKVLFLLVALTGITMIFVVDYIVLNPIKRFHGDLKKIMHHHAWEGSVSVRRNDEIGHMAIFVNEMIGLIRAQFAEMRSAAMTDSLTGLANRRKFADYLDRAIAKHARDARPCALLLLDVDFFKKYNDLYGHPAGDAALVMVADCLRQAARRPGDLAVRLGGEEFALLLEETTSGEAVARAQVLRQMVQDKAIEHEGNPPLQVLTLSCGITMFGRHETVEDLYARGDEALYLAKLGGRNQVVLQ